MKNKNKVKKNVKEIIDNIESKKEPTPEFDVEYDEDIETIIPDEYNADGQEEALEESVDEDTKEEQPERKDKIMDVLIAVFATFILMFTTFGVLKINSALKSATILNNAAETTTEAESEESTEETSTEEYTREEVTTFRNEFTTTFGGNEEVSTKEEETTKKEKETEPETKEDDSAKKAEELLNSLTLSPMSTGHTALDTKVSEIVSGMTGSKYKKLMSAYSYVVNNIAIGEGNTNSDIVYKMLGDLEYESEFDAHRVFEAYQALNSASTGNEGYASAFLVLARALGFDAYYVTGSSYKLQTSNHAWVVINIKNVDYLFDPYTDAKYGSNGGKFGYFCKTMSSLNGTYVYANKSNDKASFGFFRTVPAMTLNVDYGELTAACKWTPSATKAPCNTKFATLINVEAETAMEITANVPGNAIAEWDAVVINNSTNERIQLECSVGQADMKCVWTPLEAGSYTMTIAATDLVGRHCEIVSDIQVVGNKALSGLSVTQKAYEDALEAYIIEAVAQDGIGDVQYDFKVYMVNESGENVLVGKEWIKWNALSSIIIRIPEGTKAGTTLKIKVTAVDEASNKAEQEITINTKGK